MAEIRANARPGRALNLFACRIPMIVASFAPLDSFLDWENSMNTLKRDLRGEALAFSKKWG